MALWFIISNIGIMLARFIQIMSNPKITWHSPDSQTPPPASTDPDSATQAVPVPPVQHIQPGPHPKTMSTFQAVRLPPDHNSYQRKRTSGWGCLGWFIGIFLVIIGVYFFAPFKSNILLLGIDRAPDGTAVGRSDTIILVGMQPLPGKVKMLSIPRDLWITIPNVGENRINAVHFFAEAEKPGSGPAALMSVIRAQFEVDVSYYARVQLENFPAVIDAMGGVTIELQEPTPFLAAGTHHLDGVQALAYARDRADADDFSRMAHGQILIQALVKQALKPSTWPRIPATMLAMQEVIDTNLPAWMWPRFGLTILRALPNGLESRTLTREEAVYFTTSGGASVLLPQWDKILPVVHQMFGK